MSDIDRGISHLELFLEIIKEAYFGNRFRYGTRDYNLEPTLVQPYDFIRKINKPKTDYEKLMMALDTRFKEIARHEMYRKKGGGLI